MISELLTTLTGAPDENPALELDRTDTVEHSTTTRAAHAGEAGRNLDAPAQDRTDADKSDEELRINTLDGLPEEFREQVEALLAAMVARGRDPLVFETGRVAELQGRYKLRGTSDRDGVTKLGWHQLWLAVDIISKKFMWTDPSFFRELGIEAKKLGLRWGGDWNNNGLMDEKLFDGPHVQPLHIRLSPSAHATELFDEGGKEAVWEAVGMSA